MTSAHASRVKRQGHARETAFASLIGGEVSKSAVTDKKDVLDKQHRFHSVKGGKWWQVFLYARSRLETNTIFQGLGNLAPLMISCLDAFPTTREQYEKEKHSSKTRLQIPMRTLAGELSNVATLKAFLGKALFNGGEVNYLAVQLPNEKRFHVFANEDVVNALAENLTIANSIARISGQYDAQKVLFKREKNYGEIEVRTESKAHYKQIKCRFNAALMTNLLITRIGAAETRLQGKLVVYGQAVRLLKVDE